MSRIVLEEMSLRAQERVGAVAEQMNAALHGDFRAQAWLKNEALTTSDFPLIFQIINNATVQAAWLKYVPGLWTQVSQREVLDNLKPSRYKMFDLRSDNLPPEAAGYTRRPGSLPHVPELGQYPAIGITSTESSIAVGKFGARFPFSWEAWREDDYNIIAKIPDGLVTLARRTEDTETFGVLLAPDGSGWNYTNFTGGGTLAGTNVLQANAANATLINAALTREALASALAQAKQPPPPSASGEVYLNTVSEWALLVPSSLVPQAEAILQATQLRITDANGTISINPNPLVGKFTIVEVPYFQTMAASSAYLQTMWGIVPLNGVGTNLPTMVTTFLRGEETPELRIKRDSGQSLGGDGDFGTEGSFDNDSIDIRVRYFCGSYLLSRVAVVLSKGTGAA